MSGTEYAIREQEQTAARVSILDERVSDRFIEQSDASFQLEPHFFALSTVYGPGTVSMQMAATNSFVRFAATRNRWSRRSMEWQIDFTAELVGVASSAQTSEIQARLRAKGEKALREAAELSTRYPDPVAALAEFLENLPGNTETWQKILDEPYG